MSSADKPQKGNSRKEGLGFDGYQSHKLKAKKITKEKLVTRQGPEDDAQVSSAPLPSHSSNLKPASGHKKIMEHSSTAEKEASKKDITEKRSKKIKKCFWMMNFEM